MNGNRPPAIAKWLLQHFSSSPNIEAIAGDLDERHGRGRSRVWYWRQVAVAIVISTFNEIRSHKLLALRALIAGWAVWSIVMFFNSSYVGLIQFAMWSHPNIYPVLLSGLYAAFALASGWLVAYLQRESGRAGLLLYAASWWSFPELAMSLWPGSIYAAP